MNRPAVSIHQDHIDLLFGEELCQIVRPAFHPSPKRYGSSGIKQPISAIKIDLTDPCPIFFQIASHSSEKRSQWPLQKQHMFTCKRLDFPQYHVAVSLR